MSHRLIGRVEAAICKCFIKKLVEETFQSSQEGAFARVYFG